MNAAVIGCTGAPSTDEINHLWRCPLASSKVVRPQPSSRAKIIVAFANAGQGPLEGLGGEVAMTVEVDTLGLAGQGAGLAASPAPAIPAPVGPAGADPISAMITALTNGQVTNLAAASADGTVRREVGGTALIGSAAVHESADDVGAGLFKNLGSAPGEASGLRDLMVPPELNLPPTPPPVASLLLPPEAFSRTLHEGDSAAWRTAADVLFAAGQGHREVADSTAATANGIDTAWQDGAQQAGANTKLNSMLLGGLANDYSDLGTALNSYAEHRDTAVQNTPTPEEYDRARALLARAQSSGNPILMAQAARQLAELNTRATEAQLGYQSNVADTAAQHSGEPTTSNNIAGENKEPNTNIGKFGDAIDKGAAEAAQYAGVPQDAPPLTGPFGATQSQLNDAAERASGDLEEFSKYGKKLGYLGNALEFVNGYNEVTDKVDAGVPVGDAVVDVAPKTVASIGGGMAGAAIGAEQGALYGAAIGSVFPGPGTVIGGVVGAGLGAVGGGWVGGEFGEQLGEDFSKAWHGLFD
jgi:hypothetical protein